MRDRGHHAYTYTCKASSQPPPLHMCVLPHTYIHPLKKLATFTTTAAALAARNRSNSSTAPLSPLCPRSNLYQVRIRAPRCAGQSLAGLERGGAGDPCLVTQQHACLPHGDISEKGKTQGLVTGRMWGEKRRSMLGLMRADGRGWRGRDNEVVCRSLKTSDLP